MFKIVLQPEEQAVLYAVEQGLYLADLVPSDMLLKLLGLRLLRYDEHGIPRLTELAEVALARMEGKVH